MIEQLHRSPKTVTIPHNRNLEFYRKLIRHVFGICQLVYEWRTGDKPPGVKELLG